MFSLRSSVARMSMPALVRAYAEAAATKTTSINSITKVVEKSTSSGHVNRVSLSGYVASPVKRVSDTLHRVRVGTVNAYKNKDQQLVEKTQFHSVLLSGASFDKVAQFLVPGAQVLVEGQLEYGAFTDKDGVHRETATVSLYSPANLKILRYGKDATQGEAPKAASA
eukprot:Opistho-2@23797